MSKKQIGPADFAANPMLRVHAAKGKAVAKALDQQADVLPHAMTFTSFEFEDFLTQLTPKRFEILRLTSKGRLSIAELANAASRAHSAVSRDVSKLTALGLVKVETVSNKGHGVKKIVLPTANTISISASIASP